MAVLTYAILFGAILRDTFGVPLLPSDEKPFIIGGQDAPEAYAPYMAALIVGGRVQTHWCGGSIISKELVLTAAHCVEPFILGDGSLLETFHARVGSNQWNSGGTIVNFKGHHMHPEWDAVNIKNDIALLPTTEPLVLSKTVAIIGVSFDVVEENEECLVAGWGRTGPRFEDNAVHLQPTPDDLQALYMRTLSYKLCQKLMQEVSAGRAPDVDEKVEICTFHSFGHGMCNGDSGSALLQMSSRKLIGVVSWGYSCAHGAPDIHVRASGYAIRKFLQYFLNFYKTG